METCMKKRGGMAKGKWHVTACQICTSRDRALHKLTRVPVGLDSGFTQIQAMCIGIFRFAVTTMFS